jgi:hypothetical protein
MMKIKITTLPEVPYGIYEVKISSRDKDEFFEAIDALKNHISPQYRVFDGETRQWLINGIASRSLHGWLEAMEEEYDAEAVWDGEKRERENAPKSKQPTTAELYAALHLLPTAPPELVKSAYRLLASLNHPDHGGDELAMKRLNLIYEKLKAA